jgi:hypothetical protein
VLAERLTRAENGTVATALLSDGGDGFLLSLVQLAARTPSGDTA